MGLFDVLGGAVESAASNMERRKQTREYLKIAKEIVEEADGMYERAYNRALEDAYKTEKVLREHTYYKEKVAKELGEEILPKIKKINIPDICVQKPQAPYREGKKVGLDVNVFSHSVSSLVIQNPVPLPSVLDMFVSEEDYRAARNQKDEAKYYKQQLKYEREKLMEYRDAMGHLRECVSLEKRELDNLVSKLKYMLQEMKKLEGKSSVSEEEKTYFEGVQSISKAIAQLLSEEFLGNNMELATAYKNILQDVEKINTSLPMMPSIKDTKSIHEVNELVRTWGR